MSEATDPRALHWRRHYQVAVDANGCSVVPSACGRWALFEQAKADPSEADCSECHRVWVLVQFDAYPNPPQGSRPVAKKVGP